MSRRYFGTDGIRGIANEKLTPELAFRIGSGAGRALRESGQTLRVAMGRDTRQSGTMLGAALAAGFCSEGVTVTAMGVAPTGAVSTVVRTGDYGLGAVVSASHNPAPDNGIKLIGSNGAKLPDEFEMRVEALMDEESASRPVGAGVGLIESSRADLDQYMAWLETLVPESLAGLHVVVDGSQGAAYELGPEIFRRLGATVTVMACEPDGMNINSGCGATHPAAVQAKVVEVCADFGVAFDGDADRAVFADRQGRLVNGDRTMALWSAYWRGHGGLDPAAVVGTVMSNGGFAAYLQAQGVVLHRADVGDKYVAQRMRETGAKIGGEQSGHIIFAERGPTGDGLVTALEVARVIQQSGKGLDEWFDAFENWPQVLVNVQVERKDGWQENSAVVSVLAAAEATVGNSGRVNVRASGTQPMLRVMVEHDDESTRDQVADRVVETLLAELGGRIYSRVDLTHALGD